MKKTEPVYSGDLSHKFWKRINNVKGVRGKHLYAMGVELQNLEEELLKSLQFAEEKAKKKKAT